MSIAFGAGISPIYPDLVRWISPDTFTLQWDFNFSVTIPLDGWWMCYDSNYYRY